MVEEDRILQIGFLHVSLHIGFGNGFPVMLGNNRYGKLGVVVAVKTDRLMSASEGVVTNEEAACRGIVANGKAVERSVVVILNMLLNGAWTECMSEAPLL